MALFGHFSVGFHHFFRHLFAFTSALCMQDSNSAKKISPIALFLTLEHCFKSSASYRGFPPRLRKYSNLKDTAGQSASPSVLHPILYFGISQGSLVSFNVTLQFLFRCCKQLCQNWAEFNEEPLQQAMFCKVTVFLLLRGVLIVHCTVGEGAKKAN